MEYTSAEEFLKQSTEVRKVFIDWWQPEEGDLIKTSFFGFDVVLGFDKDRKNNEILVNGSYCYGKNEVTPLFTEGQLRRFVEDKIDENIKIKFLNGSYDIAIKNQYYKFKSLLQAYWQISLGLALKEVRKDVKNSL